jgi:hypothetical protein
LVATGCSHGSRGIILERLVDILMLWELDNCGL